MATKKAAVAFAVQDREADIDAGPFRTACEAVRLAADGPGAGEGRAWRAGGAAEGRVPDSGGGRIENGASGGWSPPTLRAPGGDPPSAKHCTEYGRL